MKILVTGGSGFIGGKLVQELEWQGHDVDICDVVHPPFKTMAKFYQKDICDVLSLPLVYDTVYHCAGLLGTGRLFDYVVEAEGVNVIGMLRLLEWLKGSGVPIISVGLIDNWLNPYMLSKHHAESYGMMYYHTFGVRFTSLRFTHVYGPGQSVSQEKAVPTFVVQALRGEPLTIFGDGQSVMNLVFVRDAASILADAISLRLWGKALDIAAGGGDIAVIDLAEKVIEIADSKSEIRFVPMRRGQPGTVRTPYDIAEAAKFFDLHHSLATSLDLGLAETIEWYRARGEY
jgi:UDP-glucose 4-epimerase